MVHGNGMALQMCSKPHIQAATRSMPMPKPECGTETNKRSSRYHLKAVSSNLSPDPGY